MTWGNANAQLSSTNAFTFQPSPEWLNVNLISWHEQQAGKCVHLVLPPPSANILAFQFSLLHEHVGSKAVGVKVLSYYISFRYYFAYIYDNGEGLLAPSEPREGHDFAGGNSVKLSYVLHDKIYPEKRNARHAKRERSCYFVFRLSCFSRPSTRGGTGREEWFNLSVEVSEARAPSENRLNN